MTNEEREGLLVAVERRLMPQFRRQVRVAWGAAILGAILTVAVILGTRNMMLSRPAAARISQAEERGRRIEEALRQETARREAFFAEIRAELERLERRLEARADTRERRP